MTVHNENLERKVKSCPFCGSKAVEGSPAVMDARHLASGVYCTGCPAHMETDDDGLGPDWAINAWNTRVETCAENNQLLEYGRKGTDDGKTCETDSCFRPD